MQQRAARVESEMPLTDPSQFYMLASGCGDRMPFDQLKRREFITLLGGAAAALLLTRFPRTSLAQDGADWVTAFPREPIHVAAWPAGRKVAVSFALFVEEFGFGQGPVLRPDLANRNPDLVNEAFRQYAIDWGIARVGRLFKELDVPLSVVL